MASCIQQSRPMAAVQRVSLRASSCSSSFAVGSRLNVGVRASRRPAARRLTTMGLFGLGAAELALIAGVAAVIFGPSKLPELGKGLGKTVKSFQSAAKEFEKELKEAAAGDGEQPAAAAKPPADKKDEPAPKP